jgi:hypothetical protein
MLEAPEIEDDDDEDYEQDYENEEAPK